MHLIISSIDSAYRTPSMPVIDNHYRTSSDSSSSCSSIFPIPVAMSTSEDDCKSIMLTVSYSVPSSAIQSIYDSLDLSVSLASHLYSI